MREISYETTPTLSVAAVHVRSTRPGLVPGVAASAVGADGAVWSGIVTETAPDASPRLPAESIARTVYEYVAPSVTAAFVHEVAVVVPTHAPLR